VRHIIAAGPGPVRWFLLDAQAITEIDVTAAEALHSLSRDLKKEGIELKIAHANRPLRETLERSHLEADLGTLSFFQSVHECVQAFEKLSG
jgi:SulP family sulfate permease